MKITWYQHEFETALHLNPDLADAHYNLARLLRAMRDDAAAKLEFAVFNDLSSRQPNAVQSAQLSNQGLEIAGKGNYSQAETVFRSAILLKPDYGLPHFNLGLVLAADGKTTEATREFEKAISLMPLEYKTWLNLGRVLRRANDFDGAYHALTWAGHLSQTDPAIQAELNSLRMEQPEKFAKLASGPEPGRPHVGAQLETAQSHYEFGAVLSERGDFEGAAGEQLRAFSLDPRMLNARQSLAQKFREAFEQEPSVIGILKIAQVEMQGWGRPP
jgi:tetratricopeptide (TPR) repeat protein